MDYSISPVCQVCAYRGTITRGGSKVTWANICEPHFLAWKQIFAACHEDDWKHELDRVRYYAKHRGGELPPPPDGIGGPITCEVCGEEYQTTYSVKFMLCRLCHLDKTRHPHGWSDDEKAEYRQVRNERLSQRGLI